MFGLPYMEGIIGLRLLPQTDDIGTDKASRLGLQQGLGEHAGSTLRSHMTSRLDGRRGPDGGTGTSSLGLE